MFRLGAGNGLFWIHDVVWLLIVVALVLGAFFIARALMHRPPGPARPYGTPWPPYGGGSPALHELDLRYARGEIERDEYLRRRADLMGQAPPTGPGMPPAG